MPIGCAESTACNSGGICAPCELEPSGVVGRHVQQEFPEILICLSGEGVVTIGVESHRFVTGVCLTLPLGEVLQISCGDQAPLSYLILKARD